MRTTVPLTGRENATMLFAAVSDVFASMGCLSKQVSVTIVITRQNRDTPLMEVTGVEPVSEPIRKVTYSSKEECHQEDLNHRPWLYKSPALPLCYDGSSPTWTRTRDRVINSHLLYQLSYRGL